MSGRMFNGKLPEDATVSKLPVPSASGFDPQDGSATSPDRLRPRYVNTGIRGGTAGKDNKPNARDHRIPVDGSSNSAHKNEPRSSSVHSFKVGSPPTRSTTTGNTESSDMISSNHLLIRSGAKGLPEGLNKDLLKPKLVSIGLSFNGISVIAKASGTTQQQGYWLKIREDYDSFMETAASFAISCGDAARNFSNHTYKYLQGGHAPTDKERKIKSLRDHLDHGVGSVMGFTGSLRSIITRVETFNSHWQATHKTGNQNQNDEVDRTVKKLTVDISSVDETFHLVGSCVANIEESGFGEDRKDDDEDDTTVLEASTPAPVQEGFVENRIRQHECDQVDHHSTIIVGGCNDLKFVWFVMRNGFQSISLEFSHIDAKEGIPQELKSRLKEFKKSLEKLGTALDAYVAALAYSQTDAVAQSTTDRESNWGKFASWTAFKRAIRRSN